MISNTIYPKKQYYIILFSLATLLMFLSLDVIIRVKDITLFLLWVEKNASMVDGMLEEEQLSLYVTSNLSYYFIKSIIPIFFGIQSYFAYIKTRIGNLYIAVWSVLFGGSMIYHILEFKFDSILYYIICIIYMVIMMTLLSLYNEINKKKH
jgi:small-conductance mechanosensitive channel